jgi:glycosyltransferase involved in cell wall biosynthesis
MMRIGYDLRWRTSTLVHYVENLLRALVVQGKAEFEFVCYGHGTDSQFVAELDGLAEFREVPWSRYGLDGQVLLPRLLRRDGVKLFHSPFYMMPFFSGVPAVVTIHDVIPFLEYTDKQGLAKMTICALNWLAAHRASAIVTVSELSKKDIVRVLGVPESKVKVAPCAVGSYIATAPKPDLYSEHLPYFACMTTRHFEAKNTALAIKGWQIFRERTGLPHKLLIGGATSEEGRARLTEISGGGDCKLLGFVPDGKLSSFLHHAEAVIVPSLYEGFGLPALEAMACGAPLISSNRASLPEVGGTAALYFDAANAEELASLMIRVATDQELRASMISRGKAQAQKFTYAESARRILSLYRQVLGTAKQRDEGVTAVEVGAESTD